MKNSILVLTGPTAVGKTEASVQLAKRCQGEIISADSMQVYRKMNIGTAKITESEMQGVPHHMIDIMEPDEEFNVFEFQKRAKQIIEDIQARGKLPILVGGTGFYIQAILKDVAFTQQKTDSSYRNHLEEEAKKIEGKIKLHNMLADIDPVSAQDIHPNNVKRVIRALEYYNDTGKPFSLHNEEQQKRTSPYNYLYAVLYMNRSILYDRIDKRVDKMMKQGLLEEVENLLCMGYSPSLVSMQGIGYKELVPVITEHRLLEQAVEELKKNTRHFAKRQMTWFRREKDVDMIDRSSFPETTDLVNHLIKLAENKGVIEHE